MISIDFSRRSLSSGPTLPVVLLAVLAVLAPGLAASAVARDSPDRLEIALAWPESQRAFLLDGPALLLTPEQRQELIDMDTDAREAFIEEFLSRDPDPSTPTNELQDALRVRRQLIREDFATPADVRAQVMFLHGRPDDRLLVECGMAYVPLEIWTYVEERPSGVEGQPIRIPHRLVFYEPRPDEPWRLWLPLDSKRSLYTSEMEYWLEQWEELQGRVIRARRFDLQVCDTAEAVDEATGIRGLRDFQKDRPTQEQIEGFLAAPTNLATWSAAALAADLAPPPPELAIEKVEIQFPEKRGQRMVTRALLTLSPGSFEVDDEGEKPEVRLTVQGVVEDSDGVFDDFRLRFNLSPPTDGVPLALAVDRQLRMSQDFLLRMTITDEVGGAQAEVVRSFTVATEAQEIETPPVSEEAIVALGEELSKQRIPGKDSLILVPPDSEVVLGLWRAEALVTGEGILKVIFLVDGEPQLSRTNPPWTAEVRLAEFPTEQIIRAEGYGAEGELLAFDEVVLNQPRGALRVRIVEPKRGRTVEPGRVHTRAEVVVPDGRRVERVEFRLNDELVDTLEKPPWQTEVELPAGGEVSYVAATAFLDDGSRAEDVRFLNAPQYLEQVDVNLVELYTAVTDRNDRLVPNLLESDFEVFENGTRQTLTKFELVRNLPLTVGITIDTSGSMVEAISEAKRAAVDFLHEVVNRDDNTFAVAFSNRANLLMPPTNDVGAVEDVLEGLQAVGWTALHDAIVTSLYYFRGIRGQRAMILLSDGDDTASSIGFRETLEYAKRSGVAIYSIGLDVGRLNVTVRNKLKNLAEETGGRSFFISQATELTEVYAEIEEELRSRYLLAYNSNTTAAEGEFREVEVNVKKRGLKARTIRGYYP